MEAKYIVAIEIGSSKIHGAVAQVDADGNIRIIASEVQHATDCVRHGRVSNVQEVSDLVNGIIRKLENNPAVMPHKISEVYLGLGGRSFTTIPSQASLDFPGETEITAAAIKRLKKEAEFGLTTTRSVLDLLPRRYYVDNKQVTNMVGTFGSHVKVDFTTIICAHDNKANLERIKIDSPMLQRRHYIIRPLAIADMVLEPNERQLGCALVDFGAETTTLSIYKEGPLQFAVTLPLGSRNVTRDLMSGLKLTEDRAEQVKIELGNAINERPGGAPLSAEQVDINQLVHARTGEIIANVIHQAEAAGYKAGDLPAGFIVVGGGMRLRNFAQALASQSKMRVRIGVADPRITLCAGLDPDTDVDIIALLKSAAAVAENSCLYLDRSLQQPEITDEPDEIYEEPREQRRELSESDDDLLLDDPDEDEASTDSNHNRSWNPFRRMIRHKRADERREQLLEEARREEELRAARREDEEEQRRQRQAERQARREARRIDQEVLDPMAEEDDDDDSDVIESRNIIDRFKNRLTNFLERGSDADLDDNNE